MDRKWIFLIFFFFILTPLFVKAQDFNEFLIPSIPGQVKGTGKHFEIKNSDYLNITLESTEEIEVILESIPRMISLSINSSINTTSAILTISGLEPNKKYFKYEDTHKNETEFFPDENGSYSWEQDLTLPHYIWIQEIKGTIYISGPEDCTSTIGIWDETSRTCTLTQDVTTSIEIATSSITLDCENHQIVGKGTDHGILIKNVNRVKIKKCVISNFAKGIHIYNASEVEVFKNRISENTEGIIVGINVGWPFYSTTKNKIFENQIFQNFHYGIEVIGYYQTQTIENQIFGNEISTNGGAGILVKNASFTEIKENKILNNPIGIWLNDHVPNSILKDNVFENGGLYLTLFQEDYSTLLVEGNTINGKPLIYLYQKSNLTFKDIGQIIIVDSKNITVENSELSSSTVGVFLLRSENCKVKNNQIAYNSFYGVLLHNSRNNLIQRNIIRENKSQSIFEKKGEGIFLNYSHFNKILANEISQNGLNGISLKAYSSGNEIVENKIMENGINGISLSRSSYNRVIKNEISLNKNAAIEFLGESSENLVTENLFSRNFYGIYWWRTDTSNNNNKFHHNNFIENDYQLLISDDPDNYFDNGYPSGGNYWSNYKGKDEKLGPNQDQPGSDGIIDTPYCVGNVCDRYPFVRENGWILPKVLISEVYYDVAQGKGEDLYHEWVIIHNFEERAIDLSGWKICDNESCDALQSVVLPPKGFAIISASSTTFDFWKIPRGMIKILLTTKTIGNGLANTGDRVILKDKEGRIVDAVSYGTHTSIFFPSCSKLLKANEGKSLLRFPPDKDTDTCEDFIESDPTIGKNWLPIPIINFFPKNPVKGAKVKFDASLSEDPDGEIVKFEWQIASTTLSGTTTEFVFNENGEYEITLIVTDNDGATSSTSTTIKIQPFSFAIITDLHIGRGYPDYDGEGFDDGYGGEEYYLTERLRNVVKWIIQNKDNIQCENATCSIKFLVILGDIADSGEKSEFLKAKEILDELNNHGIPYIPVLGNHDVWPKTDLGKKAEFPLGANYFEEIFFNENATNTKLLKEELNLDKKGFQYKNFIFKFGGINFIVLDFITRKDIGKATLHEETVNWLRETLNALQGKEPIILFSHHPLTEESSRELYGFKIVPFPGTNFGKETIQFLFKILEEYEAISEGKQILAAFGGHVHGYYPQEIFAFKIPELNWFFEANWQYPSLGTIPVLTTEALMVGSNREDEYLKETNKGVIRIVKILDNQTIDFDEIEGRYDPNTEKGKEFIALIPYISRAYTAPLPNTSSCLFFKAHAFTKREISFLWDFGDNTTSSHAWIPLKCYDKEGVYEVKLILKDKNTGKEEFITRTVEVKNEGFISKTLKLAESTLEKVKMISKEFSEDLKEIMRKVGNIALDFRDQILFQVETTRSEKVFVPVANITVHFEKANGDIDLSNLKLDSDLKKKKSLFYSPTWPEEIEKEKILFIPK